MTRQESFKRRIRARMAKTGEKYGAARRALIGDTPLSPWVADPTVDDAAVRDATGHGWAEWRRIIDAWPGNRDGHAAIAAHLERELGVVHWWAQTVALGYERITGRRLVHQQADGTFRATKSRTMSVDVAAVREMLLDDIDRADLFPGLDTQLRSRPTSKAVRVAVGPGVALFSFDPLSDGRVKVTVTHEQLPSADQVAQWKDYWSGWLDALHDPDHPAGTAPKVVR